MPPIIASTIDADGSLSFRCFHGQQELGTKTSFHLLCASAIHGIPALPAPSSFAAGSAGYALAFHEGAECAYRIWYYVPAAALGGAWLTEVMQPPRCRAALLLDVAVAAVCLARPLYGFPPASGHAIFVLYAGIPARHRVTVVLAVLTGLITLYAKIILWNWDRTLWPGLGIGLVAGLVRRRLMRNCR